MVPDIVVWGALITCVAAGLPDWVSVVLAILTIMLTAARQVVLVGDDLWLRRELETRVADRTADLEQFADGHQRLLESVGEGILGLDRDGMISFLNSAAERMLDLTTEEAAGLRRLHAPQRWHPPQLDARLPAARRDRHR